jgi:hypothetical protein
MAAWAQGKWWLLMLVLRSLEMQLLLLLIYHALPVL